MRLNAQNAITPGGYVKEKINLISKISQLVGIDLCGEKNQAGLRSLTFQLLIPSVKKKLKTCLAPSDVKKQEINSLITERELIIAKEISIHNSIFTYKQSPGKRKQRLASAFIYPFNDPSTEERLLQIKNKKKITTHSKSFLKSN